MKCQPSTGRMIGGNAFWTGGFLVCDYSQLVFIKFAYFLRKRSFMQATNFVKQLNDISSISPKDSIKWLTFERVENSLSLLYLYSNLTVKP